ncbi:cell division protein ZapB [Gammaproteobacteria bacterium]
MRSPVTIGKTPLLFGTTMTMAPGERDALDSLDVRVDELIRRAHLQDEVAPLRQRQVWKTERADLLERHAAAKTRIETIVERLRLLEPSPTTAALHG